MARHKKMKKMELDEPGMDISSLIDVCFLLLIYFLVTTQIVRKEQELSTALPAVAPSDTPPSLSPLFIMLEANGNISIKEETGQIDIVENNPDSRDLPNLAKRLSIHKGA